MYVKFHSKDLNPAFTPHTLQALIPVECPLYQGCAVVIKENYWFHA